ncbi:MAG: hypothetical protein M3Q29_24960 [Chloroflexota bacterium]|nr:hypothetical protein [Chloroflexota bacterium]
MQVVGSGVYEPGYPNVRIIHTEHIGAVKEVQGDGFLVARTLRCDVWVPVRAVKGVTRNKVTVGVLVDRMDEMGWLNPRWTPDRQEHVRGVRTEVW